MFRNHKIRVLNLDLLVDVAKGGRDLDALAYGEGEAVRLSS